MPRQTRLIILGLLLALAVSNAFWLAVYQKQNLRIHALIENITSYKAQVKQQALEISNLYENMSSLQLKYGKLWSKYNQLYNILKQGLQVLEEAVKNNGTAPTNNATLLAASLGLLLRAYNSLNSSLSRFATLIWLHTSIGPQTKELFDPDAARGVLLEYVTGRLWNPKHPEWLDKDIKAIYDWVVKNIHNVPDSAFPTLKIVYINFTGKLLPKEIVFGMHHEYVQGVTETLDRRAGDCEDQAILTASFLEAYLQHLGKSFMACIVGQGIEHCTAMAIIDGKLYILDTAEDYYASTTIPVSGIENWLAYLGWRPQDVQQVIVVNDQMYKVYDGLTPFESDVIKWVQQSKQYLKKGWWSR